jgi:hypothetical protein
VVDIEKMQADLAAIGVGIDARDKRIAELEKVCEQLRQQSIRLHQENIRLSGDLLRIKKGQSRV